MGKPGKVNGNAATTQGTNGKEHSREMFALKYLRFSCDDLIKTREFYISLGMSVEWQQRSSKNAPAVNVNPAPNAPPAAEEASADLSTKDAANTQSQDSSKPKVEEGLTLIGISTEEPTKQQQEDLPNGSPNVYKTDLCLSFASTPTNSSESNDQCHFQLIFTNFSLQKPGDDEKDDLNAPTVAAVPPNRILLPPKVEDTKKKERNQEYLVIYVHFLPRIIKRLAAKGFETLLAPTVFQGAQIAIIMDPNGIEVRLIELTEQQVDDPNTLIKRQWFARIGYYTLPSFKLEVTARYYERMFSYVAVAPAEKGAVGGKKEKGGGKHKKEKPGEPTHANTAGIRLIDQEEYVVGLTKTQFYWIGNEPRSLGFSLCFTGKLIAESQEVRQSDRSDSKLMGIGVEVPSLDGLLKRWEWERPNEVLWEPGRVRIPGIGQYSRFKDPNNDIYIEIFTPKTIDPNEALKEANATAIAAAAAKVGKDGAKLKSKAVASSSSDEQEREPDVFVAFRRDPIINPVYLKGVSKTLSEGAIQQPKLEDLSEIKKGNNEGKDGTEGRNRKNQNTILQPLSEAIVKNVQKVIGEAESGLKRSHSAEKRLGVRPKSSSARFS
ncbi:hypothetical protein BDR26DRAFT_851604 [Obelidium mucronatum]|nr:hypothetical protein BDR26DRAFT_851604 [Obelidium mucronatum]